MWFQVHFQGMIPRFVCSVLSPQAHVSSLMGEDEEGEEDVGEQEEEEGTEDHEDEEGEEGEEDESEEEPTTGSVDVSASGMGEGDLLMLTMWWHLDSIVHVVSTDMEGARLPPWGRQIQEKDQEEVVLLMSDIQRALSSPPAPPAAVMEEALGGLSAGQLLLLWTQIPCLGRWWKHQEETQFSGNPLGGVYTSVGEFLLWHGVEVASWFGGIFQPAGSDSSS